MSPRSKMMRRALLTYALLAFSVPILTAGVLMAFVPTPYQAHDPNCQGSMLPGGVRLDCDDDALAVELWENGVILYIVTVTAGFISWAIKPRTWVIRYSAFMLSFLGLGAAVLHYQPVAQVAIMGVGDFDSTWFTAFSETYFPMMTYTLGWVALASMVAYLRRRKA